LAAVLLCTVAADETSLPSAAVDATSVADAAAGSVPLEAGAADASSAAVDQLKADLELAQASVKALTAKEAKEVEDFQEALKKLKDEKEDEHVHSADATSKFKDLQSRLSAKEAELNATAATKDKEAATLQTRVKELEAQLVVKAGDSVKETTALTAKVKDLEAQKTKQDAALKSKDDALKKSLADAGQLTAKNAATAKDVAEKTAKIAELTKKSDDVTKTKEAAEKEAATKKSELDTAMNSMRSLQNAHTKEVTDMKQEHESKVGNITKEHEQLQGRHAELKARYEDPSMEEFLRNRAVKIYETNPVVAGAANKTYKYVVPRLRIGYTAAHVHGERILNETQRLGHELQHHLDPYFSANNVVAISGLLVYGMLFIPLICTVCLLSNVTAKLKLRPMLMFCHLHMFLTCLCAAIGACLLGLDPLNSMYEEYYGVYLFTQGAVAIAFSTYVMMHFFAFLGARNFVEQFVRLAQIGLNVSAGLIYFHLVWGPAMLDKAPKIPTLFEGVGVPRPWNLALPYFLATCGYAFVLVLEKRTRDARTKADKEEDKITISMDLRKEIDSGKGDVELGEKIA